MIVLPIAMVQASMVALSRKAHEHELFQQLRAREREAQAKEREVHAREREALLQRAANASERERQKLAADLHDGVIQDVTALTMRLGAAANRVGDDDARLRDLLVSMSDIGHRITRDLRSTMIELAPPELEKHGIRASLQQLLGKLERDGIVGHLDCPELDLDPQRLRLVHRVVQEAMRNAVKHARCHNFWVSVALEDGTVMATIRDDGRGFSEEERARRRLEQHNGLGLLEQTVIDGGGRLSISSEPGVGTTMALVAPPAADPLAEPMTPAVRQEEPAAALSPTPDVQGPAERRFHLGRVAQEARPPAATPRTRPVTAEPQAQLQPERELEPQPQRL